MATDQAIEESTGEDADLPGGESLSPVTHDSSQFQADLCLISVAIIWGVNIPIMKIGLEQVDVYVFNAIRLTVSSATLLLFAWREWQRGTYPRPTLSLKELLLFSLMISAVYQLLFLIGVSLTTSGNTALIFATVPLWTALLARFFIGESLRRMAWAGLIIALAGTIVVALQKGDVSAGGKHLIGNFVVLGAAILWAGGTVYSRPLLSRISPLQLSALAAVIALPLHWLVAIRTGQLEVSLPALSSGWLWLIILYSGTLSSGLSLPMWNYGVRHAGASHAAVIQNVVPVVAIVAAYIARGEPITLAQVVGGVLIVGGLLVMRRSRLNESRRALDQST